MTFGNFEAKIETTQVSVLAWKVQTWDQPTFFRKFVQNILNQFNKKTAVTGHNSFYVARQPR